MGKIRGSNYIKVVNGFLRNLTGIDKDQQINLTKVSYLNPIVNHFNKSVFLSLCISIDSNNFSCKPLFSVCGILKNASKFESVLFLVKMLSCSCILLLKYLPVRLMSMLSDNLYILIYKPQIFLLISLFVLLF